MMHLFLDKHRTACWVAKDIIGESRLFFLFLFFELAQAFFGFQK